MHEKQDVFNRILKPPGYRPENINYLQNTEKKCLGQVLNFFVVHFNNTNRV